MNKYLMLFCMIGMIHGASLFAQDDNLEQFKQIDKMDADKKPPGTPRQDTTPPPADQQEPTIITATKESSFDGKLRMAIFIGDVHVKNPQFTLVSDKLTVYFNKEAEGSKPAPGTKPAVKPPATPKGGAAIPGASPQQGSGGLEKVIAEGNVVVESERPDANGGPPVHYTGKAEKLVYNPATGEAVLSGWPQAQQDINTMVATESWTVISLNRDGTMHATGPHKLEVHDPGPDKPTPAPGKTLETK